VEQVFDLPCRPSGRHFCTPSRELAAFPKTVN
jgi:hypothetical protein